MVWSFGTPETAGSPAVAYASFCPWIAVTETATTIISVFARSQTSVLQLR